MNSFYITRLISILTSQVPEAAGSNSDSIISLFMQSGYMGKGILILLLLVSVASWAIIFERFYVISKSAKDAKTFRKMFNETTNFSELNQKMENIKNSPLAEIFSAVYSDLELRIKQLSGKKPGDSKDTTIQNIDLAEDIEDITRNLDKATAIEVGKLEKRLIFLATTGAVTPFVGLFGTVWGIMNSFSGIAAQSSASFTVIAGGIAEALINTAAGLAAAIPAVVFYNYFVSRNKSFVIEMNGFTKDFVKAARRKLIKGSL
jgi:biopolymer transport protein TolQ